MAYTGRQPWNKGLKATEHAGLAMIARARKEKLNFAAWQRLHPITYTKLEASHELAFLVGLVLGDGHIELFPRTELLQITLGTDKPALWQYSLKIVSRIFNKKPILRRRKTQCLDIRLYQKHIRERLNLPSGARRHAIIRLPHWIWKDQGMLIQCLKGLFEAEGSFSIHKPSSTYNFSFANRNISLLNEVESALFSLGLHPERRQDAVRLRKKSEALFFEKLISFRKYPRI